MASEQNDIVEQLKDAGNRLLKLPDSRDELLKLLEELENILSKVDQSPSQTIQEALLPSMKALISDQILKNPDSDIKITVAVCVNEIMRVTAPDSPYEDIRMKEIFELIVASFDNLSLLSGISYSKALAIIDNVAKVRSCVMMLDIGCDKLIIEMFEQFKRNLRPDHPASVFVAMEEIMSHVIDESEDIPLELLKVLLDYVRKEKENASSISWRLGASVIKRTSEKIKPYLRDAVKSGDISKDDYAPLIDSMLKVESEIKEQSRVSDPTKQSVREESPENASISGDAIKSDNASAAKNVLSLGTSMEDRDTVLHQKPVKALGLELLCNASANTDSKAETLKDNERNSPNEGLKAPSTKPLTSPSHGFSKKSSSIEVKNENVSKLVVPMKENEMLTSPEKKDHQESLVKLKPSGKKLDRQKKATSGGSGRKRLSSNSGMGSSEKEKNGVNETERKALRRKRDQMEDEVFETPFGKKKYKEDIVGCKLKVWWPKDKAYYEGRVTKYNPATRKHRVDYDDGDVEVLNLVTEQFEFIGDEIAVFEGQTDVKPHALSNDRANQDHSAKKSETPKSPSKNTNAA